MSDSTGLNREDMRDLMATMNRGFDGINDRLDELNGRTRRAENTIGVHEERWARLDKATHLTGATAAETGVKGDWKVLVGTGTVLGGMLYGIWQAIKAIAKP